MASDFNKNFDLAPLVMDPPADTPAAPAADVAPVSPAVQRFKTCRWQQPSEGGSAEFCTHREVKPYAGAASFDAEAWCGDCQHYKLRRVPKKRTPNSEWY